MTQDKNNGPDKHSFYKLVKKTFHYLKLVCVGFTISLLLIGLYYQFPIKVLALLLTLLITETAVHKKIRIYFYTLYGMVFLVVIGWIFWPEENNGWKPYTYDRVIADFKKASKIPDDQNAAGFYLSILEKFDPESVSTFFQSRDPNDMILTRPWKADEKPSLAYWFNQHEELFSLMSQADRLEKCRFEIPTDYKSFQQQLIFSGKLKDWTRMQLRSANLELGENHTDRGLKKILEVHNLSNHLYQQNTIITHSTALVIEQYASAFMVKFIMTFNPTDTQLDMIRDRLDNMIPVDQGWPEIFSSLRLLFKNITGLLYEINSEGKTRRSRSLDRSINEQFDLKINLTDSPQMFSKCLTVLHWFCLPDNPEKLEKIIDQRFNLYYQETKNTSYSKRIITEISSQIKFNATKLIDLAARKSADFYYTVQNKAVKAQATRKGIRIIMALKRYHDLHRQWPEKLEQLQSDPDLLIDPVNDKPFVYRKTKKSFVIYSVGDNGKDEQGQNINPVLGPNLPDDLMIWPIPW